MLKKVSILGLCLFSMHSALGSTKVGSTSHCDGPKSLLRGSMSINSHGHLEIGGVDVVTLASSSQYPVYVVDEALVRKNMHDYVTSIKKYYSNPGDVFYASKALMNLGLCKIAQSEGMGLDVSTGGELSTAIEAKFPMKHVIMHGNNKSEEEVELALNSGVGRIVVDNLDDIMLISKIGKKLGKIAEVLVRVILLREVMSLNLVLLLTITLQKTLLQKF
jgi:diaminopimelate decarboxylase